MSNSQITDLRESDYDEWLRLFTGYIAFYQTSLPEEQYPKTWARLTNPSKYLYGLVLHDAEDEKKLISMAHFFSMQTPWRDDMIMMFNDLFIDPNVRAKGYGRMMINAVAEKSKQMSFFRLQWVDGSRQCHSSKAV